MQPRPVTPGDVLFLTRRCTQRQFLLRPDAKAVQIYLYCLAEAATRFDITEVAARTSGRPSRRARSGSSGRSISS